MKIHTLENLEKRNPASILSATQFGRADAVLDKTPIKVSDNVVLQTQDNISIHLAVESIDARKIIGKVISFEGCTDDSDEYMGIRENDLMAFEEQHILESCRVS